MPTSRIGAKRRGRVVKTAAQRACRTSQAFQTQTIANLSTLLAGDSSLVTQVSWMVGSMPPSCSRGLVTAYLRNMQRLWQVSLLVFCHCLTQPALGDASRVLVLPTAVGDRSDCESKTAGQSGADPRWLSMARRVDVLISDAVEDAGMVPEMRIDVPESSTEN